MSDKDFKPRKRLESSESDAIISLDGWITLKLAQDKKLRPIQRRELATFLLKQGLADIEKADRYEEAYKKF